MPSTRIAIPVLSIRVQREATREWKSKCLHLFDGGAPFVRFCSVGELGGSFGHGVWEFPFVLPSAFPLQPRRARRALPGPRGHLGSEGAQCGLRALALSAAWASLESISKPQRRSGPQGHAPVTHGVRASHFPPNRQF